MKYKLSSKIVSLFLAVLLLMSLSVVSVSAYASGTGTESDPYCITSAQELQNVNDNPSASYKLAADIDLKDTDFVPLGNAESGAFSGTFDGNGFTISNLNVHAGKYAGLFGCNEGVIKNVTLDDIYIYGNRYLGGVCGHNTQYGTVENCTVLGGQVESDGGINDISAGGIIGQNDGTIKGNFTNSADIKVYDGQPSSYSDDAMSYAGGIVGANSHNVIISGMNFGDIISTIDKNKYNLSRIGGIIGSTTASMDIRNSSNNGDLKAIFNVSDNDLYYTRFFCVIGGLVGKVSNGADVNIITCSNNGNFSYTSNYYVFKPLSGGIIGDAYGAGNLVIDRVYNTGTIAGYTPGGIIGRYEDTVGTASISNSFQTAAIKPSNSGCGMFYGVTSDDKKTVLNCYNVGMPINNNLSSSPFGEYTDVINSLYLQNTYYKSYYYSQFSCSENQLKEKINFNDWNFDNIWEMNKNINSGYPILRNMPTSLMLNIQSVNEVVGTELKLKAFKNGIETNDVNWSITYGNASISDSGTVILNEAGDIVVTAQDSAGFKTNCIIHAYVPASSIVVQDKTINITDDDVSPGFTFNKSSESSGDFIVEILSDNENVVKILSNGFLMPISTGITTITARAYGGAVGQQKVTVTNYAVNLEIDDRSLTVSRHSQVQIEYYTHPTPTSSKITWTSSDENVATVDQNGVVTGVSVGQAVITATTDNGYSDTCTVTVNAPVTSMHFARPSVTIYKNDTDKLNLVTDPADTTDQITYSSSSTSRVTVSNDGTITAGASAGTATITATSSSGIKAYCSVTVIDQPVPVESVTLNKTNCILSVGDVFKLVNTVLPETATNKTVSWRSTDDSVASVNQDGTVTANGAGKAVITAEAENGAFAYCEVTVTGPGGANQSKIYVPDVVEADGDYVTVPVMLENNPGISFASLRVSYDSAVLEPLSISNGVVFDSVLGSIEADESEVKLCFTSEEDVYEDGVLAYVRFKVVGDLEEQTPITLCYFPNEIRNAASDLVAFKLEDGAVGAKELPDTFISGDVNDDGVLTSVDARYVLQYVTGARKFDENQLKAADMNGDGSITAVDARMILQMITQS